MKFRVVKTIWNFKSQFLVDFKPTVVHIPKLRKRYTVRIFTRDISRTQRLRVKVRCFRVKLRWKYWIKWAQIKARLVRINLYDSWVRLRKVGSFITQYWLDQMGPNQSMTCQDQFVWFLGLTTKSWEYYHTILVEFY